MTFETSGYIAVTMTPDMTADEARLAIRRAFDGVRGRTRLHLTVPRTTAPFALDDAIPSGVHVVIAAPDNATLRLWVDSLRLASRDRRRGRGGERP